jgi:hypothetical protein
MKGPIRLENVARGWLTYKYNLQRVVELSSLERTRNRILKHLKRIGQRCTTMKYFAIAVIFGLFAISQAMPVEEDSRLELTLVVILSWTRLGGRRRSGTTSPICVRRSRLYIKS